MQVDTVLVSVGKISRLATSKCFACLGGFGYGDRAIISQVKQGRHVIAVSFHEGCAPKSVAAKLKGKGQNA